jgi:uncharacterized membrane protein
MKKPPSSHARTKTCAITGENLSEHDLTPLALLRPPLAERIRAEHPDLQPEALLSHAAIGDYRSRMIEDLLREERGELTQLEQEVIRSLRLQETVGRDVEAAFEQKRTLGQRLSDRIAEIGGSWSFILCFGAFLAAWMGLNIVVGLSRAFDPYPFILLNLVLSTLAAVQAPIIMMSQRRQEARDRLRAENDYQVNLKAELEIRHLHEKVDHLITRQWERLAEIQRIQVELLEELTKREQRP